VLPIQFALELETAINKKIDPLLETAELFPVITLINSFQQGFFKLLIIAKSIDVDTAKYPVVEASELLGSDTAWQQLALQPTPSEVVENMDTLTTLWSICSLIDRSTQYYQQAAANNAHPATRLFFHSLAESKKIIRGRLAGIIHLMYNQYWGQLGFAPFMLGKD
jgi:hypothetical protein